MASPLNCAKQNIVLTGFMGSGKSHISRLISRESGLLFIDTDALLELREGMSVVKIFATFKESGFREREVELCTKLEHSLRHSIISTGGGTPLFYDVRRLGRVFFLDIPFEKILARLQGAACSKRPLFSDPKRAQALYEERYDSYQSSADYVIDANRKDSEIAKEILAHSLEILTHN